MGTHLSNRLLNEENNVVTVFDREQGNYSNIKAIYDNLYVIKGDFDAEYDFHNLLEGQDVVYHLVSTTAPSTSNINMIEEIEENIIPTIKLLEACVDMRIKKIIFLSSGGTVYGGKKNLPLKEDDVKTPICSYGIQKLMIEKYIQLYHHMYGLDYRIVRLSNPYGLFQNPKGKVGAVTTFLWKMMHNERITIYGDGSIIRDYIYVDDAIDGILSIMKQVSDKKVFNLGSGIGYSLNDVVAEAEKVLGKKAEVFYEQKRKTDVAYNVLDISRYVEVTGERPRTGLYEGMKKMASFYFGLGEFRG